MSSTNNSPKEKPSLELKYRIPGDPTSLARARMGNGHMYDTQKNHKVVCGIYMGNQHKGKPHEGPIHLHIDFFFKFPPKKKITSKWYCRVPDLSNLIKFYEDAGTGVLWIDDRIICKITAQKQYDAEGYTELTIYKLED